MFVFRNGNGYLAPFGFNGHGNAGNDDYEVLQKLEVLVLMWLLRDSGENFEGIGAGTNDKWISKLIGTLGETIQAGSLSCSSSLVRRPSPLVSVHFIPLNFSVTLVTSLIESIPQWDALNSTNTSKLLPGLTSALTRGSLYYQDLELSLNRTLDKVFIVIVGVGRYRMNTESMPVLPQARRRNYASYHQGLSVYCKSNAEAMPFPPRDVIVFSKELNHVGKTLFRLQRIKPASDLITAFKGLQAAQRGIVIRDQPL
ncbi:hypothetical protein R3P38DRAFT_2807238 [Favolaschia claudopus]|uniref:Uncharacterized protein n=1 Tax=Favolaschia claudopus TaxID=2862362 RepID=A0AAV9ZJD8_9AGAR